MNGNYEEISISLNLLLVVFSCFAAIISIIYIILFSYLCKHVVNQPHPAQPNFPSEISRQLRLERDPVQTRGDIAQVYQACESEKN